jgi:predicted dehydrogenase/aryl-alcohol dehydrogenase-like predicted oxidoreductase
MSEPRATLNWGILSTGRIAGAFASHLPTSRTGKLVAVGSRSQASADEFAKQHGNVTAHGSYDALLADENVQAVYLATPHPQHAEWAIKAARAGKHVLCEKPLCLNRADAEAVVFEAEQAGVVLMEAFMYRCHPMTEAIYDVVAGGKLGRLQLIHATFSFMGPDNPESRLMNLDLGGGGILDVGCYATSIARLLAGAAQGQPFAEPKSLKAAGHLGDTGVDEWATATLDFGDGVLANLVTGVRLRHPGPQLRLIGTDGTLTADNLFIPAAGDPDNPASFRLHIGDNEETLTLPEERKLYAVEADTFAQAVAAGEVPHPAMSPADTLGNMATLDQWRQQIKLTYPAETPENYRKTRIGGEPLERGDTIPTLTLDNLAKPVSRFVMGCDSKFNLAQVGPLYDAYHAAGGRTFDTASVYGELRSEALGDWLKVRGVRDDVSIICKGAHTPHCYPPTIALELKRQLDWLGTDHCDLYFMHRDNPDVPVGEFVDALNDEVAAGRIKGIFGGSNWTLARVKEANEYARANGKQGFGAVSQQLSLAEMTEPVWAGCQSIHADEWRSWLAQTHTANFAWSSQARGFFVPERDLDEPELQRCWVSDANLERRRRATELAEAKGTTPINVAAAWVLKQPFPSIALIGPRALSELASSLGALGVELTDAEHDWLDLKADRR